MQNDSKSMFSLGKQAVRDMSAMDLRSLALYRVLVALILLYDLWVRSHDLVAHYTDQGILPRDVVFQHLQYPYTFSLHMISGHWLVQALLFGLAALAALALLFGWRTRLATFLSWLFVTSIQARNPLLLDAGDGILQLSLFWAIFLPIGAIYSIDQLRSRQTISNTTPFVGLPVWTYLLQMSFIYWFSLFFKVGDAWLVNRTAVYYAVHSHMYVTHFGEWFQQFDMLFPLLTRVTLWTELYAPILLFIPFWGGRFRLLGTIALLGMHFSFQLCLNLGLFSIIPLIILLPLLPPIFWETLSRLWIATREFFVFRWFERLAHAFATLCTMLFSPRLEGHRRQTRLHAHPLLRIAALYAFVVIFWANVASVNDKYPMPKVVKNSYLFLQLTQNWGMFSPNPPTTYAWYVFVGELEDGSYVDLFKVEHQPDIKPTLDWKFHYLSRAVKNYRHGNLMGELWDSDDMTLVKPYVPHYVRHLCKVWETKKDKLAKGKELLGVALFLMVGENLPNHKRKFVGKHQFYAGTCPNGEAIK